MTVPGTPKTHLPHTVYTREHWFDEWEEVENLYADSCVFSCAPDISKASLYWRYGHVAGFNETDFALRDKKDLLDYYVKISIERPTIGGEEQDNLDWYGVVVQDTRVLDGAVTVDNVPRKSGRQTLTCLGLEYLLTRKVIDTSIVADTSGGAEKTINRAIAFNLGSGNDSSGTFWPNMHTAWGKFETGIFAADLPGAAAWASINIIRYLIAYHSPRNAADDVPIIDWAIDPNGNHDHLNWHKPMLHVQGRTFFEVLNMLIDRRRLSSWCVKVIGDEPHIHVFTFNRNQIDLPDGKTIPANANQFDFDFDTNALVRQPTLTADATTKYQQVWARGERRGYCFTVSSLDSSLEKNWSDALQTAYNTGASGEAGYAALDETGKQQANQAYRRASKFARVYRSFRIPPAWNGKVGAHNVFINPDNADAPHPYWVSGLRFENYLPLKTDVTYGDDITAEDLSVTTGDSLTKSKKEFRRPFAFIKTSLSPLRYEYIDRLSHGDETSGPGSSGRAWSAHLIMEPDAPAVIVDVQGQAMQHVIAADEFTAVDDADRADYPSDLRWQTLFITVFCLGDQYAEQKWPDVLAPDNNDVTKILIIDVPNMRLDYVAPLTNTDLKADGDGRFTANGGYIHDDRTKLLEIARVAFQWYNQTRQAFEYTEHSYDVFEVGDLIKTIGTGGTQETVNSVVTQLAFDLRAGTHTIRTQFGELDFTRAVL